ncbi:hypothetical protein FRC07_009789 [Ceratobasidium sp. 392]|nr:hypothetical protein FRC07_009789 [Ceratobasidium sp. 392]
MASLAPPAQTASPRVSAELDSQAPTLTPPTAHSSPRHEHATLPPSLPADGAPVETEASVPAPVTSVPASTPSAPQPNPTDVAITFLLISGTRQTMHFAPTMTFGRVKEAFWGTWTPENAADKPPAPSFLRVLHMGKILSDDQTLAGSFVPFVELDVPMFTSYPAAKFPNVSTNPAGTIVHISIRPFGPPTDEDIVKAKRRSRRFLTSTTDSTGPRPPAGLTPNDPEASHPSGCCSCIIC